MEDQGKRLLLAVVAAFGVMMLWMVLFPPDQPEQKPADESAESTPAPAADGTAPVPAADGTAPAVTPEAAPAPAAERGPEQTFTFDFDKFDATFSSWGGALKSWTLDGDKYEVNGRQMDLVPPTEGAERYPFVIAFPGSTFTIPADAEWRGERIDGTDRKIRFTWSSADLRVIKDYTLYPDDYLVDLTVTVQRLSAGPGSQALAVSSFGYQDPEADTGGGWTSISTEWRAACNVGEEVETWSQGDLRKRSRNLSGNVLWGGFSHSYFFVGMAPRADGSGQLACNALPVEELRGGMRVDVVFPAATIEAGQEITRSVTAYLGPKYLDKLEEISTIVGFQTGFADAIDLGWFSFIARPLLWLLQWFHGFVMNWGIAIILLTILVKLATLYWTTKSMRSMKAMGKLRPEIEKIQKKYKDDRQRQQVEIMNLYKAHKVNPLAGCLPMLLQMPIWFALYRMLMAAAELYREPFIPGWINDLTGPDPYYILPVLLMGMMFLQARLAPMTADSTQQKIFQYGLPLMFGFFGFFFPSGLTLYILTNTVLTTLHQLWINRHDRADMKKARGTKKREDARRKNGGGAVEAPKSAPAPASAPTSDDGGGAANEPSGAGNGNGGARPGKGGKKKSGRKKRR